MDCPACGSANPDGFRFCGICGSSLLLTCSACGAEVPPGFKFCGSCGQPVESDITTAKQPDMLAGRRIVTVLFADLVGFSTLAEFLDPEELSTLMTQTFDELTAEVEKREGVIEKFIGDAVVAIFGAPIAHEDDPIRAVETALSMLEIVQLRSSSAPSPLQLRIGINSGLVVTGPVGDGSQTGVMGDAVNVAARLQQAADAGEILVSESIWRRTRDSYDAEAAGSLDVKGREQRVLSYRIGDRRKAPQRAQAAFVGRSEELALLDLLWSSAAKGNTHVISVVGEPGVGKSRFLAEFAPRQGALDLRVSCRSERAFGPFLDLFEQILRSIPTHVDELKKAVHELGVDEETGMLIGALLGLAGGPAVMHMADEAQKRQVFAGVWRFLLSVPGDRPTFILFDDIHSADRSSLDLLGFLLERLAGAPFMLVLSSRPAFGEVERTVLRASHTAIRLEPLSPQESVDLARGFLGVDELPHDLEELVASRAEGNPFFIEELLQALLEIGSLSVDDGRATLADVDVDIPDTVQGTILARIDRLGRPDRQVLQYAAVVGRDFSSDLIEAVVKQEVETALEELARSQLLVAQGPRRWAFKHALIREVTYETLLLRERKELHRRVAEALEAGEPGEADFLESIAEHYANADVPDKARAHAVAAGDLAMARMAFAEAQERYDTALRLWGEGDVRGRLELLLQAAHAARMSGDSVAARTYLVEAEEGWRSLGDMQKAGAALAGLGRVYWMSGESDRGIEVLQQAIETLEVLGPSAELVRAYVWSSTSNMLLGHVNEGSEHARRGLEIAESLGLVEERSHLLNTLGCCEGFLGDIGGLAKLREALKLSEQAGDAEVIGRAYVNLSEMLEEICQNEEALDLARVGQQRMVALGAPQFEAFLAANEASFLVGLGRHQEAERICRDLLGPRRAVQNMPGIVNASRILASVLIRRGSSEEARDVLEAVKLFARRVGGEFHFPILALEAELEAARGNAAVARHAMAEAAGLALETSAIIYWLRVAVPSAMYLSREEATSVLDRCRYLAERHPAYEARVLEASGWIDNDLEMFRQAADLYASLDRPYEEARCRLECGDLEEAGRIITALEVEDGPLGQRLRELVGAPA